MDLVATSHYSDDIALVERCLERENAAFRELTENYEGLLKGLLVPRGASLDEADEIVARIWSDCVARESDQQSLLTCYAARCSLKNWLATVATNRLIDLKRSAGRAHVSIDDQERAFPVEAVLAVADEVHKDPCETLHELLEESLLSTLRECNVEHRLMIRLVYLEGLTQREVSHLWGWTESKVSRAFSSTMDYIRMETLAKIARKEPWLTLSWGDFLQLASVLGKCLF